MQHGHLDSTALHAAAPMAICIGLACGLLANLFITTLATGIAITMLATIISLLLLAWYQQGESDDQRDPPNCC